MTPPILVLDFPSRGPQGQGRSVTDQLYRLGTIFQSVTWFWNGTRMQIEFYPPAKCHRIFLLDSAVGSESDCLTPRRACHTVSQSPGLPPNVHLLPCGHPSTLTIIRLIRIKRQSLFPHASGVEQTFLPSLRSSRCFFNTCPTRRMHKN
jgi:hypothetical protein